MEKLARVWECLVEGSRTRFFDLPFSGKSSGWFREILVPTLGNLVFAIFGCSQLWERLFLWFLAVPNIGNARFLRFSSFPKLGTPVFVKFNVSQSWERGVFYNPSRILLERHY